MPFKIPAVASCQSVAWTGTLLFCVTMGLASPSARAQMSQRPAPSATYVRYTPSECAQAPRHARQLLRGRGQDTLPRAPFGNRLDASTIEAVRACVAQFSVTTVPANELLGLGATLLAADQDMLADSAFQRAIALDVPGHRAWTLYRIVAACMDATPSRIGSAQRYMAQLDALGIPAAAERLQAHLSIVTHAQAADSLALMETHVNAALDASRQLVGDSAKQYAWVTAQAYVARADLEARRDDFAAMKRTMEEAATVTTRVRPLAMAIVEAYEPWFALLGQPAPRIQATKWVNTPTDVTPVVPTPGQPILLVFITTSCDRRYDACYPNYVVLRRLLTKHPTLPVAFVTATEGSYRSRLVSADSESNAVGEYFAKFLKLRGPIAVWQTKFERRSDNYMMGAQSPNESAYPIAGMALFAEGAPKAFLIDAQGVIRRTAQLTLKTEIMLDRAMTAVTK